jgi:subtilisin family serine protease
MKKLLALSLLLSQFIFSQTPSVVQQDLMNFEPGELIVKLKDDVDAGVSYQPNGKSVSDFNIGELLGVEEKIASSKVMFHQNSIEASIVNSQKMKAVYAAKAAQNPNNGYTPKDPLTMKNIFVLKTNNTQENILQLIQQIQNNPNVEYAEPNYIYGIDDFEVGETITAEQAAKMESSLVIDVNDPLYPSQTNITATNIDDVWEQYTTGDGSQVIAILDTGGDYTHPDLEANTWINEAELNGVAGFDDDGNGYIDDIRGWDFINLDNAPLDDNMHGTHVAGIAGAVGNNGIGIAGAAWNVKLMHIKVFQSTGQGSSITIAEGVEYASNNGATILNMSFGSFAESSTLKLALENVYATAILVAAAGNNGVLIGPCAGCSPMYPGAYNFVFGVEDFVGIYDNYDEDGPTFSRYFNLLNYELQAPGSSIMSTVPNGGYATLTGTSMATPLVAGAMALYNQVKPDDSKELMFGSLISTSTPNVDFLTALLTDPIPDLRVVNFISRDTIGGQNGNGIWERDETIEILPLIKNYWGPTDDVRVGIEFADFEDQTKATIVQDEIEIGSISAYATLQDLEETLKITIAADVANNVDIRFNLTVWSGPDQEYMSEPTEIVINIKNSILFSGTYNEDITLTPDNEYLVVGNVALVGNTIMTIEPGTILKFSDNIRISVLENSKIIANGTKNEMIILIAEDNYWYGFNFQSTEVSEFSFTEISRIYNINGDCQCILTGNENNSFFTDVLWYDNIGYGKLLERSSGLVRNNFYENSSGEKISLARHFIKQLDGIIYPNMSNNFVNNYGYNGYWGALRFSDWVNDNLLYNSNTNIFSNISYEALTDPSFVEEYGYLSTLGFFTNSPNIQNGLNFYIGTTDDQLIDNQIMDLLRWEGSGMLANRTEFAIQPYESAHGIVWKIEVNGYDAQDEYASLDALGVGTHEFKVYFNREMDTSVNPQVSYGVTIPYNQKIISEEGSWSADGKIYTVTHEVNIGAADGINRIRVQDAQDLDYFKIPVEDMRFNFLLQSAGSASTGFFAAGGLGKIDLEWVAPSADDLDDVLGYNMYRYQVDVDGVESEPEKLNETLIIEDTDESTTGVYFSDYAVLEGETYFYKYKILRTSFETTDYSSVVSTAPLTSTLGDSNGDFAVDVLDLVHDVDYILGNNPQPFIFVAGDVNADNTINVLDIVGTVDIILNGDGGDSSSGSLDINFYPSAAIGYADFSWEGNDLYVESMHNVGGLQLAFESDFEYVLHELPGIERLDYTQDGSKILMLYSFNNTSIASTKTKLLTRIDNTKDIDINLAVAGTTTGAKLTPRFKDSELEVIESPFQSSNLEFLSMYPNPSSGEVTMKYYLPEQMDGVVAKVYDMLGRLVHIELLENKEGASESQMQLNTLQNGNYIVLIIADKDGGTKHISNKILIIK